MYVFFFFKQKTAYEIYQCDWSSDVCSSDLFAFCILDKVPDYKKIGRKAHLPDHVQLHQQSLPVVAGDVSI